MDWTTTLLLYRTKAGDKVFSFIHLNAKYFYLCRFVSSDNSFNYLLSFSSYLYLLPALRVCYDDDYDVTFFFS